jgi:hypothetical protein
VKRRPWSEADVATLRALYPTTRTADLAQRLGRKLNLVYAKAVALGLRKDPAYMAAMMARISAALPEVGAAHRWKPGNRTWNKGTHYVAGGRSTETRFKPGQPSPRWDPQIYCIGALRINYDGGLDIKVDNGRRGWQSMARYVWETERGPIPPKMAVRSINGDSHDTRIENLRLATQAELMRENTLHNYPKPLARAIQLRGALNRRINRMEAKRG